MPDPGFASSQARHLAAGLGIDPEEIDGTGRGGAVTVADLRATEPAADGLGEAGQALWRSVKDGAPEGWGLDEREAAILALAARQADDLAALDDVIREEGPMAVGSAGQPVVHPAVAEARQARLAIGRLLGQIGLPDEASGSAGTDASRRGQKAARARWSDRNGQGAGR